MPSDLVTVYQVNEWPDPRGFSVFEIRTSGPVVTTTNPFLASLCRRALELHRRISVTWRQDGWGVRKGRLTDAQWEAA